MKKEPPKKRGRNDLHGIVGDTEAHKGFPKPKTRWDAGPKRSCGFCYGTGILPSRGPCLCWRDE